MTGVAPLDSGATDPTAEAPVGDHITLRSHLSGSIIDIVESCPIGSLSRCSLVASLICQAVDYREEGSPIHLDVYLTDDFKRLSQLIPNCTRLTLGSAGCDESGIAKAIKKSAPLSGDSWKVFVEQDGDGISYGVFRDSANPLNVPIESVLVDFGGPAVGEGGPRFIRVAREGRHRVCITTNSGRSCLIDFTSTRQTDLSTHRQLPRLVEHICSKVAEKSRASVETYLTGRIESGLRSSHGSLIAVTHRRSVPRILADHTPLNPVIDIAGSINCARSNADAMLELNGLSDLLMGLFKSDGIIVFSTDARLLGFNAFVKPVKSASTSGGARSRAFESLRQHVGKHLACAFFQSHDGHTMFEEVSDVQ